MRVLACLGLLALQPAFADPDIAAGKILFVAHCSACHGKQGEGGRGARLTTLTRAPDNDSLFSIIRKGIPGTEMPAAPLNDAEITNLVVFVRSLQREPTPKMAAGNARGEQVYRQAGCAKCHTVGPKGGVFGPDLTNIGALRNAAYLRRAVLEPQADIPDNFGQYRLFTPVADNFLQVRVTLRDGRAITGARLNEDAFSIQLRDVSGRVSSFWKTELKELHKDWGKSPMPAYGGALSSQDIDDLVSYLSFLRGAK